ncbi:YetF domain-containing protein [Syntrophaceticus schinkii]|jgi:uncharacterized membrane protein YcaP (DUF421 family)|uniref:YetF C-terminal domain-containing protein n=1 Tax=Syntrophaceticus schinkii TaxID=499207 RepID=A0A0B7MIJ2_9FIRM|nr:DUF421 domain-containing protein [Syntrophaceticus schinkii]CEO88048.1 conserved membrane hypothetical protein [Syntrophaceticus schinkii]
MLLVAVRALILYTLLVVVMRLMGKRQIGQLQPFELVITIVIAELAVIPMSNTGIPLINGIVGILVLMAVQIVLSLIILYSEKARKIICGNPIILINNGKPVREMMRLVRINISDLLEQLRNKEYPNISDIAYAVLETNGSISVIPKADVKPPTARDLGTPVEDPHFPISVIMDGNVMLENLKLAGITIDVLQQQARTQQITDLREVFFAQYTTEGKIDFFLKGRDDYL